MDYLSTQRLKLIRVIKGNPAAVISYREKISGGIWLAVYRKWWAPNYIKFWKYDSLAIV